MGISGWRAGHTGPKTIFKVTVRWNLEQEERCKGHAQGHGGCTKEIDFIQEIVGRQVGG